MTMRIGSNRGQAILMTTLSLTLLFGIVGLALDLGWGHYVQREAQAAADAAALAAASKALEGVGQGGTPTCGTNVRCQDLSACPATDNLNSGCLYGRQNGFS